MKITLDISYYPLQDNYIGPIDSFIDNLRKNGIDVEVSKMSTSMVGDYDQLMGLLKEAMGEFLEKHPSVFNIKLTNYVA